MAQQREPEANHGSAHEIPQDDPDRLCDEARGSGSRRVGYSLAAVAAIILTLALGTGMGVLLDRLVLLDIGICPFVPGGAGEEFELMAEAWRTIERHYVNQDALVEQSMSYGAIEGIIETLDDPQHTRFLSPEAVERHRLYSQGQFEGIGAYIEERDGQVVIVTPMENSPAQEVGLKPGDAIVGVDGEDVTGLPLEDIISRVTGPAGTEVTLTIEDAETGATRTVVVERAAINFDLVSWERLPGTGLAHLRIASFSQGATADLRDTLREIEQTEGITGLVLDLRNNPGGLLWEAVETASQFVESGVALLRIDRDGNVEQVSLRGTARTTRLETVILVNDGTASGAEIVTGALQDHGRAIVVGTTTAGAGTVLNEFKLDDGSVLLLAVEEWRTPDGRVIWHQGLDPDVVVELPPDVQPVYPRRLGEIPAEGLQSLNDLQLQRAIDLLTSGD